ncbi:MAG: hypothetical protein R2991_13340 [Thermoanaerobaculia bacterium]
MDVARDLQNAVAAWLRRERSGHPDAEPALTEVYRRWPSPVVPAGFASRVLAAAGLSPAVGWLPTWVWRWGFAAGLVLVLAAGLQVVSLLGWVGRSGWLAEGAAAAVVFLGRRLGDLEAVGGTLLRAGRVLSGALDSPWTLALCLCATLLATGAFLGLQTLLVWDRSARYANS